MSKNKKDNNKMAKTKCVSMAIGFVVCFALLVVSILTVINLIRLKMVPGKYIILFGVGICVCIAVLALLQRWFVRGIIAKIFAILLSVGLLFCNSYLIHTKRCVNEMAGISTKIDNVNVYVLAENNADSLEALSCCKIGILKEFDRNNTDIVMEDIKAATGNGISVEEYETAVNLAEALYGGDVNAIVMNSAYVGIVTNVEDYVNFEADTRIITEKEIETEIIVVEDEVKDEYLYNGDKVFTLYVSGIDTRGSSPKVNSNSDVNILLTVNMDTRQILLISTPRDFYVPLSISGGVKDKLTHAGGYGIDVSVETLEMLYGVNIDDYVKFNFTGFMNVVEELGGIEVYSDYDFVARHLSGIHYFKKGLNTLNGEQALAFARERKAFADGDRQRGKNQMAVIEAIIKKMASSDTLKNYEDILESLTDSMVTSMSYDRITELIKFQLNDMKGWDVVKYSVTGYDSLNTTYSAGSMMLYVMVPDEETVEQAKEYIRQIYAGERVVIE